MTKKKKNLIINIFFYTLLVIIYVFVTFGVITKFTGNAIYLGNLRADVVLTDSMSVRNEEHLDFLEGTTQIQPFDLVFSNRVDENTQLEIKDCVLFRSSNYYNQIVCHRIVGIEEKGVNFKIENFHKNRGDVFGKDYITLDFQGCISLDPVPFQHIEIEMYTKELMSDYLIFQINRDIVQPTVNTTKVADHLYKHIISYDKDNNFTYGSIIYRATESEHYITSIRYESNSRGVDVVDTSKITVDEGTIPEYKRLLFSYKLYEIRADKAYSSDDKVRREEIISKVSSIVPKIGHIISFLQSIPGIIMMVGIAIIITVASYLMGREDKKNKLKKQEENGSIVEEEALKEAKTDKNHPNDSGGEDSPKM